MNTEPEQHHSTPNRPPAKRIVAITLLLSAIAAGPAHAVKVVIPLAGVTDSYAECVLDQVGPKVGPVATASIESDCRTRFPGPSKRSLLDPRSVQACYKKNESLVVHRKAAEAVFNACQDYFRASSVSNASQLRGSRLK